MKKRKNKEVKKENLNLYYIISLLSLILLIYIIIDIKNNILISNIDLYINNIFSNIESDYISNISKFITNLFEPLTFIVLSFIIILYLFSRDRNREAIIFLMGTSLAFALGNILKIIIQRARPDNILVLEKTFSFPSTHALMAVIFFGIIIYLSELHIKSTVKKTIVTTIGTLAALIMGLTRIILNAHWFSDVIAGFVLGVLLLCIFIILIKKERLLKRVS